MQVKGEISQTMQAGAGLAEGTVISFVSSGLPGLGMVGGTMAELDSVANKFVEAPQARPELASITTAVKANTPGYEYEIDRDKAEQLGVEIDDVFTALQVFWAVSRSMTLISLAVPIKSRCRQIRIFAVISTLPSIFL